MYLPIHPLNLDFLDAAAALDSANLGCTHALNIVDSVVAAADSAAAVVFVVDDSDAAIHISDSVSFSVIVAVDHDRSAYHLVLHMEQICIFVH